MTHAPPLRPRLVNHITAQSGGLEEASLTVRDVARRWGVETAAARRVITRGEIECFRVEGRVRVSLTVLRNYEAQLAANRNEASSLLLAYATGL
jgi:hypothetical protein